MKQLDRQEKGTIRGVERRLQLKFIPGGAYILSVGERSRLASTQIQPSFNRPF